MTSEIALTTIGISLFLLITFAGVFIYLIYIYRRWSEVTIGLWATASLFVTVSLLFSLIGLQVIDTNQENSFVFYRIAQSLMYSGLWAFGISHLIARRNPIDVIGFAALSIFLGFVIQFIWSTNFKPQVIDDIIVNTPDKGRTFDIIVLLFLIFLYVMLSRDSFLIYKASSLNKHSEYRRNIALTHLLAWQFLGLGLIIMRSLLDEAPHLELTIPGLLLLVPLLTLASRPFDWAREGYEPLLLLLIDEHGTPSFSWTLDTASPLLMEGTSVATVKNILEQFVKDDVDYMTINFKSSALYARTSNGYLSILLTSGSHQSFDKLLDKIHSVLVTAIAQPSEFGIPTYEIPTELKWLLQQLLPQGFDHDQITETPFQDINISNIGNI